MNKDKTNHSHLMYPDETVAMNEAKMYIMSAAITCAASERAAVRRGELCFFVLAMSDAIPAQLPPCSVLKTPPCTPSCAVFFHKSLTPPLSVSDHSFRCFCSMQARIVSAKRSRSGNDAP
eukprot:2197187-Rhodomonas_salina.2